jgi:hypothetical protein
MKIRFTVLSAVALTGLAVWAGAAMLGLAAWRRRSILTRSGQAS